MAPVLVRQKWQPGQVDKMVGSYYAASGCLLSDPVLLDGPPFGISAG